MPRVPTLLEDIGRVTAVHDLVEGRKGICIVCLPILFDEADDCLLDSCSNPTSSADKHLQGRNIVRVVQTS